MDYYDGEIMTTKEHDKQEKKHKKKCSKIFDFFRLTEGWMIDATETGSLARFINHSYGHGKYHIS